MKYTKAKRLSTLILAIILILPLFSVRQANAAVTFTGIDTLMIYNPLISFDNTPNSLSSGNMSGQIDTGSGNVLNSKAVESVRKASSLRLSVKQVRELAAKKRLVPNEVTAQPDSTVRSVGDTMKFWIVPNLSGNTYSYTTMTCRATGTHCNIWSNNTFTNTTVAARMASEFDSKIYANDTSYFGSARFAENGTKVNILIYTMSYDGQTDNICGFFDPSDLYTSSELTQLGENPSQYNTGSAIVHINTTFCTNSYLNVAYVTMAHEFQHLINFTSTLKNSSNTNMVEMGVWLNEAMSMQAEELSYTGEVEEQGYISDSYNGSSSIARGLSLYSFETSTDIGVYGQGFLFSEYLKKQYGGVGIFSRIHSSWRTLSSGLLNDGANLEAALGSTVVSAINNSVIYDSSIISAINNTDNSSDNTSDSVSVFLSKLNLNYQLATVLKASSGIYSIGSGCATADPLLCTSTSVSIQGGGRIFVRTKDGNSYTVPSAADSKLIYVGFKNGLKVFGPTTAAAYSPATSTPTPTVKPTATPTPTPTVKPTATPTPRPPLTPLPDGTFYGDADCNGQIEAKDASVILRTVVKLQTLTAQGIKNGDVDRDGEITAKDASTILRYIVRLIPDFSN